MGLLKRVRMLPLLVVFLFTLTSCEFLVSQNPKDSFLSKEFPRQLELIRNQIRELTQKERDAIVERSKLDEKRADLVRVGVIDTGVDIAHKDLLSQIDYRVIDGQIEGAGYDLMGDGKSGTHILVDPSLFAFGAKEIRNGLIVEPMESPLQYLKQANEIFRDLVYKKIQSHPDLMRTIFKKIPKESISLYQVLSMRSEEPLAERAFDVVEYEGEKLRLSGLKEEGLLNFELDLNSHELMIFSNLEKIKNGEVILEIFQSALEELDQQIQFEKQFNQYQKFLEAQLGISSEMAETTAIDNLKVAFDYIILGTDAFDPISKLEQQLRQKPEYAGKTLVEVFDEGVRRFKDQIKSYKSKTGDALSAKESLVIQNAFLQLDGLRDAILTLQNLKKGTPEYNKFRSEIRKYVVRTQHPYIVPESNTTSHGTHVAGIIARQDPNIRIVPIRVTTSSVKTSKEREEVLVNKMASEFREWLNLPLVKELRSSVQKEYGGLPTTEDMETNEVRQFLSKDTTSAFFLNEVIQAVKISGENQLKIANMSLGQAFEKDHSLTKKFDSYVNDLFSEFVRFQIGKAIQDYAPETLFVIASGNDGKWVDGVSRIAFPAGITSTRLLKIAKEMGLREAPNNSSRNILAVGSVNENSGTLTSFTNIIIDPNIPQVFSTGEEVHSSIPAKDIEQTKNLVGERFSDLMKSYEFLNQKEKRSRVPVDIGAMLADSKDSRSQNYIDEVLESLAFLLHLRSPIGRENMSGTSMATPTVAGLLARYALEKMKKEGIATKEAYGHPSLRPSVLIDEILTIAKQSSFSQVVTIKMLIEGINKWENSDSEMSTKQYLDSLMEKPIQRMMCAKIFG